MPETWLWQRFSQNKDCEKCKPHEIQIKKKKVYFIPTLYMDLSPARLSAFFVSKLQLTELLINPISWTPFRQPLDVTAIVFLRRDFQDKQNF